MNDIYKNIEEYKLNKKHKMLIVFDDMIADMFMRITQSCFAVCKNIRRNSTHHFILKRN